MAEQSKISWTDSTVNFWEGCAKVSAGCANCYAAARDARQLIEKVSHWGKGAPRRKSKSSVKDAPAMNRKPIICDHCGTAQRGAVTMAEGCENPDCPSNLHEHIQGSYHRRRIFSLSLGDWLDDEVPIEWLVEMLDTIRQCDQVTWILCTKRPHLFWTRTELAQDYDFDHGKRELCGWLRDWRQRTAIPANIILLTSVENQEAADRRIPELLKIPAACHGLSLEPLLGPVNVAPFILSDRDKAGFDNQFLEPLEGFNDLKIKWCIAGGESGSNARPCEIDWLKTIVMDCAEYGCACFIKQLGAAPIEPDPEHDWRPVPNIRDKKGGDPAEWPAHLRVQEWPKGF